ncbi:uncharacterized protein CCOS01_10652 [Colletotrichum costaricense]|uniref:Uncharacterized protein n=1 Tax=Colletotrichum costaricense TaxID=1209916 RepID=A0AAJ0DY21_9PEZI|nr:uncharacterized protein CCOS01_10652 [Colletotrichum costaricense]KAK1520533.1 hypothetical protein CCOS01_10652 [Colletotrichum costaricense]
MSYNEQLNEGHHGPPSTPAGQPPPNRNGSIPAGSGSISVPGSNLLPMVDLESLSPQQTINMEAKNDQGLFETVLAASTGLDYSYASSSTVATLGLRKLPLSPTHNRRLFHTPFGIMMLKDFASFTVRVPEANVPEVDVNVAVLGPEYCWKDVEIFFGMNLSRKMAEARAHSASNDTVPEREQLEINGDVPALPPEIGEVPLSASRRIIGIDTIAAVHSAISHGRAGRRVGRPVADADLTIRTTDLMLVEPAAGHSRSTSGLGATPVFTTGGTTGSSPPSTYALDRSRNSYHSSQCEQLAPIGDSLDVLEPGTSPGGEDDK